MGLRSRSIAPTCSRKPAAASGGCVAIIRRCGIQERRTRGPISTDRQVFGGAEMAPGSVQKLQLLVDAGELGVDVLVVLDVEIVEVVDILLRLGLGLEVVIGRPGSFLLDLLQAREAGSVVVQVLPEIEVA